MPKRDLRSSASPAKTTRFSQPENAATESERHAALLGARKQRLDTLRQATFAPLNVIDEREGEHSLSNLQVTDLENGEEDNAVSARSEATLQIQRTESQEEDEKKMDRSSYINIRAASNAATRSKTSSRETGV